MLSYQVRIQHLYYSNDEYNVIYIVTLYAKKSRYRRKIIMCSKHVKLQQTYYKMHNDNINCRCKIADYVFLETL